jgi:hypothetical protein
LRRIPIGWTSAGAEDDDTGFYREPRDGEPSTNVVNQPTGC